MKKSFPDQKSHQFESNVSKTTTEVRRLHILPRNCSVKIWGVKRTGCKKRNLVLCFRRRVIQSVTEKGQNIQTESCTSGTRREDSWSGNSSRVPAESVWCLSYFILLKLWIISDWFGNTIRQYFFTAVLLYLKLLH